MLKSINLENKTYEEMLGEAITQIPLYSEEWTNFNLSDPGITLLQNLTSFNLLQQTRINEVTEDVRRQLLRLVGFEAAETTASRVLVEAAMEQPVSLPAQMKMMAGDLCFEFEHPVELEPWGIETVYTRQGDVFQEITYLLSREVPTELPVFGAPPQVGNSLYCILNGCPKPGEPLRLYVRVAQEGSRNPFAPGQDLVFAHILWQVYTREGWQDVAFTDETHSFLVDGLVTLQPPRGAPAIFDEVDQPGYAVRCLLMQEEYDITPKIRSITANLVEMVQRDTLSKVYAFPGGKSCMLDTEMAYYQCVFVYAREERGGPYREYREETEVTQKGRLYRQEKLENGNLRIVFDKQKYGFGPMRGRDAIRVVCCSDEMVHHRNLGRVYGYDDQEIDVQGVENILKEDFSVLVRTREQDGEYAYQFVGPDAKGTGNLCYQVDSREGKLLVLCPEEGDDCHLLLGDLAVTAGGAGNIREENIFLPQGNREAHRHLRFVNPAPGAGGITKETVEELRRRFVAAVKEPTTAVTASDHEAILLNTPGLCIHKVKAVVDRHENLVRIAVKPHTESRLPALSDLYLRQMVKYHDAKRMITTRVEFLQPRYVAIEVKATIYVKSHYENAREEIEAFLNRELDYVASPRPFGDRVRFDDIHKGLTQLPCVDFVYDLAMLPRSRKGATVVGADIQLGEDSLCYPGKLMLELQNSR